MNILIYQVLNNRLQRCRHISVIGITTYTVHMRITAYCRMLMLFQTALYRSALRGMNVCRMRGIGAEHRVESTRIVGICMIVIQRIIRCCFKIKEIS